LQKYIQKIQPMVEVEIVKPEYITCAAILFQDGKEYEHQPVNVESGIVITGHRHSNCYHVAFRISNEKMSCSNIQGFLTSHNRFVTRQEAYQIAAIAGQVKGGAKTPVLVSEDLY
jgi:hypothetical protein